MASSTSVQFTIEANRLFRWLREFSDRLNANPDYIQTTLQDAGITPLGSPAKKAERATGAASVVPKGAKSGKRRRLPLDRDAVAMFRN